MPRGKPEKGGAKLRMDPKEQAQTEMLMQSGLLEAYECKWTCNQLDIL